MSASFNNKILITLDPSISILTGQTSYGCSSNQFNPSCTTNLSDNPITILVSDADNPSGNLPSFV